MVKLVDTADWNRRPEIGAYRFDSGPGHQRLATASLTCHQTGLRTGFNVD